MAGTPWTRPQKLAFGTLIAAAVSAVVALGWLAFEFHKFSSDQEAQRLREWQRTVVYNIIDEKTKGTGDTISFQEIQSKYVTKAEQEKTIQLGKDEIQTLALQRILMNLEGEKLIGHWSDKYYVHQTNPCGNELSPLGYTAQKRILLILKSNPGKYDANQLHSELGREIKIDDEEYGLVINCLMSRNYVGYLINHKLFAAAYPPQEENPPAGEKLKTEQRNEPMGKK